MDSARTAVMWTSCRWLARSVTWLRTSCKPICYFAGCEVFWWVCLFVCLLVYLTWLNFTEFLMRVACGRASVFLWERCDILCTSGFMDGVDVIAQMALRCVMCYVYSWPRRENSRNYSISSNQILLSDKNQEVHAVGCARGRSLLCVVLLLRPF